MGPEGKIKFFSNIDYHFRFDTIPNMKTDVPGLYRGIQVWKNLCGAGEASLDQLAGKTGYPKASILRMLKTLCDLQLIERDDSSGLYRPIARIAFANGTGPDVTKAVFRTLETLSSQLKVTAEWFKPSLEGLLLTQRAAPSDTEVQVQARTGFLRTWGAELDAVAVMGYAFYSETPPSRSKLWSYDSQGEPLVLSATEARSRISEARLSRAAQDLHYNTNGVKRIAAAVIREGSLTGVLSLACAFTPSLKTQQTQFIKTLHQSATELQSI